MLDEKRNRRVSVMDSYRSPLERGLVSIGIILVGLGLYFSWAIVPPSHEGPVISIGIPGMDTGITSGDVILLLPGLIVLLFALRGNFGRLLGFLTFVVGLGYLSLPFFWNSVVLTGPFVLGLGAYVTGFGGVLVASAGVIHLLGGDGNQKSADH